MNSILYATSIGTCAAWLGIGSASMVGIMHTGSPQTLPALVEQEGVKLTFTEGDFMEVDVSAGGSAAASEVDAQDNQEEVFDQEAITPDPAEILPEVPELADLPALEPLPEVPELPEPQPEPKPSEDTFAVAKKAPAPPKATVRKSDDQRRGTNQAIAKRTESGTGTGSGSAANTGSGAGEKGLGRISGGRRPKPPYPPQARKQGIEGTVQVMFTFGEEGQVLDCSIIGASHPSLNDPCIKATLMRWKVPGARGRKPLSVRFDLN